MGDILKMKGRLLTFDKLDKVGILFSRDCKITYPDMVPLLFNFNESSKDMLMGSATVSRDDSGLICDAVIYNMDLINLLPEFNGEFPIGGFYTKLKEQRVGSFRMIDEAYLSAVSVVLAPADDEYKMSVVRKRVTKQFWKMRLGNSWVQRQPSRN